MNRMLPKSLFCLVTMACALCASTAFAQDEGGSSDRPFIGVGIELSDVFSNLNATSNGNFIQGLYIPINLAPNLRIEPLLTIASTSRTQFTEDKDNMIETTVDTSTLALGIGVGAFYMWNLSSSIDAYGGGRLQYIRANENRNQETNTPGNKNIMGTKTSANAFGLSGVVGMEWYFIKYMSLGGEAQLNFLYQGTPTTELDPNPGMNQNENTDTRNGFGTGAELFLRFYFM